MQIFNSQHELAKVCKTKHKINDFLVMALRKAPMKYLELDFCLLLSYCWLLPASLLENAQRDKHSVYLCHITLPLSILSSSFAVIPHESAVARCAAAADQAAVSDSSEALLLKLTASVQEFAASIPGAPGKYHPSGNLQELAASNRGATRSTGIHLESTRN